MVCVVEHGLDVPADEGEGNRGSQAGGDQVQKSGLGVFEEVHHDDGGNEAGDVGDECGVKVERGIPVQRLVVAQHEGDEDARNDDVAEPKHGHVLGLQPVLDEVLGEHEFDGGLEALGHRDHDVGAEDPEDVVEEEAPEEDAPREDLVEVKQFNPVDCEGQAEEVVGQPVLLDEVPQPDAGGGGEADEVGGGEVVRDVLLLLALLVGGADLEVVAGFPNNAFRNDSAEGGAHHVGQGEDAEGEEVHGEQEVDVLLAEDLEEDVESEEGAGGDEGEHCRVLLGHGLGFFSGLVAVLLHLLMRLDTAEASEPDRKQGHDQKAAIGQGHALRGRGDLAGGAVDGSFGSLVDHSVHCCRHLCRGFNVGHVSISVERFNKVAFEKGIFI